MLKSAKNTSSISDFVFYYDDDDPFLGKYIDLFSEFEPEVKHFIGERVTTTKLYNKAFNSFPNYEFYTMTNDDFIFKTHGWDETLCQKGKICYGNDLCARELMPTCPVIDGDIVRTLGWLQLPILRYMYGDAVWKEIALKLNNLSYYSRIIIEHRHWLTKKVEIDETYKNTNSEETYQLDAAAFERWKKNEMSQDIEKIRAKLEVLRLQ